MLAALGHTFKFAIQEVFKNKLRSLLSIFGVTIGIFCIIGVLATVDSLEKNIRKEISSLGTNTIYIDKWQYSKGPDFPYWKFAQRPSPLFSEISEIRKRTDNIQHLAFKIHTISAVSAGTLSLNNVRLYGISEEFPAVQPVDILYGRSLTANDFERGTNSVLLGYEVAEIIFGEASFALNRNINIRGKKQLIVGVLRKQGNQMIGGWSFDKSVIMNYRFARTIMNEKRADPLILAQGKENIDRRILKDDLRIAIRAVRKLKPAEEDNFSLNHINDLGQTLGQAFSSVNLGGWAIGALSFIVGIFGVANIMFVTVKERTAEIGIKKSLGATNRIIITEVLLESVFLCLLGGLLGIILVAILAASAGRTFGFPIFLSPSIIFIAFFISVAAGILAGFIPAYRSAKLDPAIAIRG